MRLRLLYKIILLLFLVFAIVFSFKRYTYFPLDGDLPGIVLPSVGFYQTVIDDPFGLNVLLHDSVYPAPNRFFTHWTIAFYFKNVPLLLQKFASPIDSIYLACALAKTAIQFFLVFLIAIYITGKRKIWDSDVLLTACIIIPLFQTYGYNQWMGIIDHSITYTFFYALSLSLVMLFFLPFFMAGFHKDHFHFKPFTLIFLLFLSVVISFSGPLNTPLILLICSFIILYFFFRNLKETTEPGFMHKIKIACKKISPQLIFIFGFAIIIGLYSFYIGLNNSENLWETLPIAERYARLPYGFLSQFTGRVGPGLLVLIILINVVIIKRQRGAGSSKEKMLTMLKWFAILSLIYIVMLPLGGYRSYRPNIIRWDTIMPVTLGLVLFYGLTTYYVIKNIKIRFKWIYYAVLLASSLIFIRADRKIFKNNRCERDAIEKLSESAEKIVLLENDCSVFNWGKTTEINNSEDKTRLLLYWGVIKEKKLYYQKEFR